MNLPCQNTCRHAASIHKALYRREAEGISVHMASSVDAMKAMIFSTVSRSSSSTDNMMFGSGENNHFGSGENNQF